MILQFDSNCALTGLYLPARGLGQWLRTGTV